jgi:DNA-binding GntR family transcriptional regulator
VSKQVNQQDDGSSSTSLELIVQRLEEEIVLGRLRPRERLVEEDLVKYFGTKRHVIRAALLELQAMGIVARQPNRGATVRDFTAEEVEQIYDVRQLLEGAAARTMPLPPASDVIAALKEIHARHSKAVEEHDLRTIFRANLDFHRVLFAACGNPYLAEQIDQLAARAHAIRFHTITDPDLVRRARDEHQAMIESLEKGERDRLMELVSRHLRPSKDTYLKLASTLRPSPFR